MFMTGDPDYEEREEAKEMGSNHNPPEQIAADRIFGPCSPW